jgi:hypothetical protein
MEERACHYQVIVQITNKYRGSFNTLAFGEIKPYTGSLKDGRLGSGLLSGSGPEGGGSIPALDSALTDFFASVILFQVSSRHCQSHFV